jgi:GGDEF domain-containing protein
MSPEAGRDLLAELSNAVAAYLSTMEVTAECLDESYPEVGSPYRKRIQALQSRVSYDATPKEIRESAKAIQAELRDYASVAKRVRTERSVELEREILALGDIIENLAERQAHFGRRLREFAAQVEKAMPVEAAGLHGVVDSMSHETAAMVGKMLEQMVELDQRLAGAASTDPVTGLINRRELERQIEAHRLHGATFSLLLFELEGPVGEQVLQMAGAKLASHFRHRDRTARWSEREFAVLFLGENQLAEARAAEVLPWLTGRYTLENGESVLIEAKARLLERELAAA